MSERPHKILAGVSDILTSLIDSLCIFSAVDERSEIDRSVHVDAEIAVPDVVPKASFVHQLVHRENALDFLSSADES
jgi:hypothetical protein